MQIMRANVINAC